MDNITITITITANEKDSVLKLSRRFGNKKSRTGKPDIDEADPVYLARAQALSKQDVFDIIYIDTDVIPDIAAESHDYWYNSPWVSTDALFTLNFEQPPRDRGLVSLGDQYPAELWSFPPDYDTRVISLLKAQLEQAFGESGENLEAR